MSICTHCGFKTGNCACDDSTNDQFESLSYTNTDYSVPENLIRAINRFKTEHSSELRTLADALEDADESARNVRLAYLWSVGSIRTDTDHIDELTADLGLNDFSSLKSFLEATRDGDKKWAKVHDTWTTDLPEHTARNMLRGDVVDAQAVLSGLHTDEGRSFHYMRPTKANMVTRLLGDTDSLCLDSRRHRVLRPLLKDMLPGRRRGPDDDHGKYRQQGTPVNADHDPAWSERFLQTKMERNPGELRTITTEILDALEDATRARRDEIGHILFCLAGPTTFHEPLQELLE